MTVTTTFDHDAPVAGTLPVHPLARALPPMTPEEFDLLKADIRLQGLLEPITLLDGAVLDGIHRQRACSELGITPATVQYSGHSPAAFVLSRNVRRRHLSVGQQAKVADALTMTYETKYPAKSGGGTDLTKVRADFGLARVEGNPATQETALDIVATAVGVDPTAALMFRTLRKQEPRLAAEVAAGTKSLYGADAERKAAAKEATQTDVSRRQTKSEAAKEALHRSLEAARAFASTVRVLETLRREFNAEQAGYAAGVLKAIEQSALELRRIVQELRPALGAA